MGQYTAGWITVPGKGKRWRTADGEYLMQRPAGGMPGVFGSIRDAWRSADKHLGGWLPGGGTGNPLSAPLRQTAAAVRQASTPKAVRDLGSPQRANEPWVGKPGQFRNSWTPLNAMDAITKAGANPFGLAQANPNDIKLTARYYSENPQVSNQYDLRTNLFLRYLSGAGTKDLEIGPETGREIYQAITKSHDPIRGTEGRRDGDAMKRLYDLYGKDGGALQRLSKGHVPVRYDNDFKGMNYGKTETAFGLGQFWAEPQSDNSYIVSDKYDFFYAPKSKGGTDEETNQKLQESSKNKTVLGPSQAATRLLTMGVGTPYPIRLRVYPDGGVQVMPSSSR